MKTIYNDPLIKKYANNELEALGNTYRQAEVNGIRMKIRTLARLVLQAKADSLDDLLLAANFDRVVTAAQVITKTNLQLGKTIGSYIYQAAAVKLGNAVMENNTDLINDGERFLHLYKAFWSRRVARVADKEQRIQNIAKNEDLPLSTDIKVFMESKRTDL